MNDSASLATFVQRWWAVLLCGAVVAGGVSFITAKQITETFEAEAQLLVGPVNTTFDLDASGTLARTYAELGATRPVLARAIATARADIAPKDLEEALAIESNEITRIVTIRVQDHDPALAADLANAIAGRLVQITSDREGGTTSGLDRFSGEPELTALTEEGRESILNAANRVFGPLAGKLSITESATPPDDPVKPSIPLIVVLAALAGVLLASAVALTMESRGSRAALPRLSALFARRNGATTALAARGLWDELRSLPAPKRANAPPESEPPVADRAARAHDDNDEHEDEDEDTDGEVRDRDVELRSRDG